MKHLAVSLILAAICSPLFAAAKQPNVLVIFADDLGYSDIGVHGGKDVPTPNIDALAASGVRCTNGYVSSPYCSPSRAGFLTGRYQTHFGHEFNPHVGDEKTLGLPLSEKTIADHLRAAGYATGLIGKWHQGFNEAHHPQSRGFDDYFGFLVGGHNYLLHKDAEPEFGSAHSHNMIYRSRELQKLDGYTTDLFTDEALGFMDRHKDKPWFLYLAYNAVHTPLEIKESLKARIPASVTDEDRRGYLSLLVGLDDNLGRVVGHLKNTGIDKDTLIFFVSDNGGSGHKPYFAYNTGVNKPLRGDKGQTLEGGIHVPFFVVWPGKLPAGKVYEQPVITLDILPTALASANVGVPSSGGHAAQSPGSPSSNTSTKKEGTRGTSEPPKGGTPTSSALDGMNLLPFLTAENNGPPHDALFWRFSPQKAVRKGKWKLVDWRDFDAKKQSGWQLYDLETDIGETHDLSAQHSEIVAELSKAWDKWNERNVTPLWHGAANEDPTAPQPAKQKQEKKPTKKK